MQQRGRVDVHRPSPYIDMRRWTKRTGEQRPTYLWITAEAGEDPLRGLAYDEVRTLEGGPGATREVPGRLLPSASTARTPHAKQQHPMLGGARRAVLRSQPFSPISDLW